MTTINKAAKRMKKRAEAARNAEWIVTVSQGDKFDCECFPPRFNDKVGADRFRKTMEWVVSEESNPEMFNFVDRSKEFSMTFHPTSDDSGGYNREGD